MSQQRPGKSSQHVMVTEGAHTIFQIVSEAPQSLTSNWYLSRKEIEDHSPSRKDGIDLKKETQLRKLYCSFLQDLGMKLRVPQVTIATAMMLCHRFYLRQSLARNEWQTIATVSMFLACKVEEIPRLLTDVVIVAYETMYRRNPTAAQRIKQKEVYEKQKELILIGERLLLSTIAFDFNIQHPYEPLVSALKKFKISQNDVAKVAWNFVNDWLCTTLCLQYKPHYIAAGSLFLAAKFHKLKLPSEKGMIWWQEFDVAPRQLEEVTQQMLELLEQNKKAMVPSTRAKTTGAPLVVEKVGSESSPSSVLNGSDLTSSSHNEPGRCKSVHLVSYDLHSQNPVRQNIEVSEKVDIQCQTSDCGSTHSVVEDSERFDEVEDQSRTEPVKIVGSKIISVSGVLSETDKDRIKSRLKRRRWERNSSKKAVAVDDNDDEAWIERELENGIEVGDHSVEKKPRFSSEAVN